MLNLLSVESAQLGASIASIVVSAILSIVLIIVTVVVSKQNNQIGKQSVYLPIRIDICKSIMNYSNRFYDACSKLITHRSTLTEEDFKKSIDKLDDLNTDLYEILVRAKALFPQDESFWKKLEDLFNKADDLQDLMFLNQSQIVSDMENLDNQIKKFSYNNLMIEVINNNENYKILINNLSAEMIKFLDAYKKVYNMLDQEINYTNFLNSTK